MGQTSIHVGLGLVALGCWLPPSFAEAAEPGAPPVDFREVQQTEARFGLGGQFMTGNTLAYSASASADVELRRGSHQFATDLAGNYGRAQPSSSDLTEDVVSADDGTVEMARNLQLRARYDEFLAAQWKLYLGTNARHDSFQGLAVRVHSGAGAGYHVPLKKPGHDLWIELGYDFQVERFSNEAIDALDIDPVDLTHSARIFVGYELRFNHHVEFEIDAAYMQNLVGVNHRLYATTSLTARLVGQWAIDLGWAMQYDSEPLPGFRQVDTMGMVKLVYSFAPAKAGAKAPFAPPKPASAEPGGGGS